MYVAVLASTPWAVGVGDVVEVDVDQAGGAGGVTRLSAHGYSVAELLILEGKLAR